MLLSSMDCTMYPSVLGSRWYLNPSVIAGIITVVFTDNILLKFLFSVLCNRQAMNTVL